MQLEKAIMDIITPQTTHPLTTASDPMPPSLSFDPSQSLGIPESDLPHTVAFQGGALDISSPLIPITAKPITGLADLFGEGQLMFLVGDPEPGPLPPQNAQKILPVLALLGPVPVDSLTGLSSTETQVGKGSAALAKYKDIDLSSLAAFKPKGSLGDERLSRPSQETESEASPPNSDDNFDWSWLNPVRFPGRLIQVIGEGLEWTNIPVVKQTGRTVQNAGQLVESPGTLIEAGVTLDGDTLKEAGTQFTEGGLGVVGLHGLTENSRDPSTTSSLEVPDRFADAISTAAGKIRANAADNPDANHGASGGYKNWHASSMFGVTQVAGLTELPWIWLGGLFHELDPRSIEAELYSDQGISVIYDSPGDLVANTFGVISGLVLPESAQSTVAEVALYVIPGPPDTFKPDGPTAQAPPSSDSRSSRVIQLSSAQIQSLANFKPKGTLGDERLLGN